MKKQYLLLAVCVSLGLAGCAKMTEPVPNTSDEPTTTDVNHPCGPSVPTYKCTKP